MIRQCVVCGKDFKCSPSDKTVTCSKECSRINKSRTHQGKRNVWSDESRKRLSDQGQTDNLLKGTEAAKKSPNSGRFETNVNAIIWKLTSPEGKVYICKNLHLWVRNNCSLFGLDETDGSVQKIYAGLRHAKRGFEGKETAKTCTYKGWKAEPGTKKEYDLYRLKNADLSKLSAEQRACLLDYLSGIKVDKIAEKYGVKKPVVYSRIRAAKNIIFTGCATSPERLEYHKNYYQKNKDKIYLQTKKYADNHPEKKKEFAHKWYVKNKERQSERNRKYYQENRERLLARQKERYRKKKGKHMNAIYISKAEGKETMYEYINGITVIDENRVAIDLYDRPEVILEIDDQHELIIR